VSVSASLGVAICPADGDSVPILLRRADEAMYAAKGAGRNQIRFFADIT
jgi:GGDEF domain-containing protein